MYAYVPPCKSRSKMIVPLGHQNRGPADKITMLRPSRMDVGFGGHGVHSAGSRMPNTLESPMAIGAFVDFDELDWL